MPLDVWMAMQHNEALASLAGVETVYPWDLPVAPTVDDLAQQEAARAAGDEILRRNSALRDPREVAR